MGLTEILLACTIVLLLVVLVLLIVLLKKQDASETGALQSACVALEKGQQHLEATVRDEIANNRRESGEQARVAREEISTTLKAMGESLAHHLATQQQTATSAQKEQLVAFGNQIQSLVQGSKADASQLREELFKLLNQFGQAISKQATEATTLQAQGFEQFEKRLATFGTSSLDNLNQTRQLIDSKLSAVQEENAKRWDAKRAEDTQAVQTSRKELNENLQRLADAVARNVSSAIEAQRLQNEALVARLDKISGDTEKRLETLRGIVDERLKAMQEDNTKKLDLMRQTVDEKLQGTLDKRLGESFKQVSERLEQVHKGLGEMQTLANGVGDLKKVLSNVKTRGTWGEIQLGNLLEQILSPQQFARDVATIPNSAERVEFAIKLPGRDDGQDVVWLPIDAKFPQEDYARLIEAQDAANAEAVEAIGKQLESQIKKCAQDICGKYIQAPYTTDFGIMFLPVEGLYAEVIRRTGLVELLQREYRVVVAGPTTLAAILNSLQMGFKTLAIQKQSSEVWTTLGAVKTEFIKFGGVLDGVQKKLQEAANKIDETRTRSRAIERKLRAVEAIPEGELDEPAALPSLIDE